MRRAVWTLLAGGALLAGVGTGAPARATGFDVAGPVDTAPVSSGPVSSEPIASEPTTSEPSSADQAAAEAALLTIDDFPEGWVVEPSGEDSALTDRVQAELVGCAGGDGETILDLGGAIADTDDFMSPNELRVSETVTLLDEATAEDFMVRFSADTMEPCMADVMQRAIEELVANPTDPTATFPTDTEIGTVTATALPLTPAGDGVVGHRITIPVLIQGLTINIYLDAVVVRSGRALAGLSFQSQVEAMPTADIDTYLAAALMLLDREGEPGVSAPAATDTLGS